MGQLRDSVIRQTRDWLDGTVTPIPPCDWNNVYPITIYDAIFRTTDPESTTLGEEIDALKRLIDDKQGKVDPGTPGNLMSWTGTKGQIGTTEVVKKIDDSPSKRSLKKVVSEKAAGDALDLKLNLVDFNTHTYDDTKHITEMDRHKWDAMTPMSSFQTHLGDRTVHITDEDRTRWNSKADIEDVEIHMMDTNNPHKVTAEQLNVYTREEVSGILVDLRENFVEEMTSMILSPMSTARFDEILDLALA